MKALFYSIKGGQGKTTHAIGYAKYAGFKLYTNDYENGTGEVYESLFKPGQMKIIKPGEPIEIPNDENIIFDFGGWVESRIIQVAKIADVCIVPIYYQSTADLMPGVKTILTLEKHCKNIVILINNTEKSYLDELGEILKKRFPEHPVFIINRSKYIARLADESKTVFDLFNLGGLHRYSLGRLIPQVKEFYNYMDNFKSS